MGHGTAHAVFFGLSILAPAFGRATYYTQSCKQMPLFLVTGIFIVIQLGLTTLLFLVKYNSFIVGILYLVEKFVASFQISYKYQVLENCSCITLSLSLILHILTWSLWWKCWCLWSSTALTTLGFFLLHTFSMIIAFNGYTKLNRTQQLFVPVMHLGASLLVRSASCSSILVNILLYSSLWSSFGESWYAPSGTFIVTNRNSSQ